MKPQTFTKKYLLITHKDTKKVMLFRPISPKAKVYTVHDCLESDMFIEIKGNVVGKKFDIVSTEMATDSINFKVS